MVPARCRAKFARSWADLGANTLNIHPLYCSMHTVDNTLCTGIVGIALPTQVRLAGVHYTVHSHSFKGENCCTGKILQETKDEHSHGRVWFLVLHLS